MSTGFNKQKRFIMMDNASNNDTFMEHLEIAQLDAGYCFNAGEQRLRLVSFSFVLLFYLFP